MKADLVSSASKDWIYFVQNNIQSFNSFIVILLYEKEYPLSFIGYYIQKNKDRLTTIDLADAHSHSVSMLAQLFGTTFLGQKCIYLLKTPWHELTTCQQKFFIQLINTYNGPHYCIIPIERADFTAIKNNQLCTVQVPAALSVQEAILFAREACPSFFIFQQLLTHVSQKSASIHFDIVIILFNYASVISANTIDEFVKRMMPILLNSKQSLYELSGALFAKKSSFFTMWASVESMYSIPFWITFWSDQMMKAALFNAYKKNNLLQEAKALSNGLPFSFLNKDWRLYNPQGLLKGYTLLYEYDCRFKDTVLIKSLDSFFIMFFNKHFD